MCSPVEIRRFGGTAILHLVWNNLHAIEHTGPPTKGIKYFDQPHEYSVASCLPPAFKTDYRIPFQITISATVTYWNYVASLMPGTQTEKGKWWERVV